MNYVMLLLVVAIVLGVLIWQRKMVRRAKTAEGRPAPATASVDGGSGGVSRRVYFFHAVHCGPCRAIAPMVERMSRDYPNLIAVDVAEHPELARDFGIAATPSFIAVADGHVSEVKLGAVSEQWLRGHLGAN